MQDIATPRFVGATPDGTDGGCVFTSAATNLDPGATNGMQHVYLRDRSTSTTTLISRSWDGAPLNESSYVPQISADGRYVSFHTVASNLLAGDTNGVFDVVVHDRLTGATAQASVAASLAQPDGNSFWGFISADGRTVTFVSRAANLVAGDSNGFLDVFVAPNPLW